MLVLSDVKCRPTNGNVVVVIDHDQIAELQVSSSRGSFTRNALHSAAIAKEAICVVVNQLETWFVKDSGGVCLCDGKSNSIREALTERTGRNLNSGSVVSFGVTWCDAVDLL